MRLRSLRRWLTRRATDAALVCAPHLSVPATARWATLLGRYGPRCPVLARLVAENMRAAGVYSPAAHRAYFAEAARHLAGALQALRCVQRFPGEARTRRQSAACGEARAGQFIELARREVELGRSVELLRQAGGAGHGALLVGPHICNYLLALARLNQAVHLTVYLRHSEDARRSLAKRRWYSASGVDWISEPADEAGVLGRLGRMSAVLAAGGVLFITPDLPQKRDAGVPVRLFGREVYLPGGVGALAARSGAPVFMLIAGHGRRGQRLEVRGPWTVGQAKGEDRRDRARRCLHWFAAEFEAFVRATPELWYLWGDKRWTRVFHGDPRYATQPAPAAAGRGE